MAAAYAVDFMPDVVFDSMLQFPSTGPYGPEVCMDKKLPYHLWVRGDGGKRIQGIFRGFFGHAVIISFKKGNEVEMKQFFDSDDWGILCEDIERRQLAVLMAAQTRLGQKSVLATLNGDLIREIARISVS